MGRLRDRLQTEKRLALSQLFHPNMHKSTLVGMFLAILELVRHYLVSVEQNTLFGEVWVVAQANMNEPIDLSVVDHYERASI